MLPDPPTPESTTAVGARLAAQTRWLQMLLLHLASARVRAHASVDDLMQEVLLRACTSELPPSDAGEGNDPRLRALLATIARHVVVDVVRALRAAKRGGGAKLGSLDASSWAAHAAGVPDDFSASTLGPATRVARADEHRALMAAFEQLEPDHRRVLGLRQFEGRSAAETGDRMGRSEVAVHSLYRRALQAWAAAAEAGGVERR